MTALTQRALQRQYDDQSPPEVDDGQPEDERIAELLGLPHDHWLADAIADAMGSGDWLFVGHQCHKHLAPRCAR